LDDLTADLVSYTKDLMTCTPRLQWPNRRVATVGEVSAVIHNSMGMSGGVALVQGERGRYFAHVRKEGNQYIEITAEGDLGPVEFIGWVYSVMRRT
jgi:hypothetical protein